MIVATLFVLLYCLSSYGFSLFLYDHYNNDPDPTVDDLPTGLVHAIIFLFSAFWPVTIGVISLIRAVKK